jgi:hypothetical protein
VLATLAQLGDLSTTPGSWPVAIFVIGILGLVYTIASKVFAGIQMTERRFVNRAEFEKAIIEREQLIAALRSDMREMLSRIEAALARTVTREECVAHHAPLVPLVSVPVEVATVSQRLTGLEASMEEVKDRLGKIADQIDEVRR